MTLSQAGLPAHQEWNTYFFLEITRMLFSMLRLTIAGWSWLRALLMERISHSLTLISRKVAGKESWLHCLMLQPHLIWIWVLDCCMSSLRPLMVHQDTSKLCWSRPRAAIILVSNLGFPITFKSPYNFLSPCKATSVLEITDSMPHIWPRQHSKKMLSLISM